MPRSFKLRVTQSVINASARENSKLCMIAGAVKAAGGKYPVVTSEAVSFNLDGVHYSYPTPAKAAAELIRFDRGEPITPFVLTLDGRGATTREIRKRDKPSKRKVNVKKLLPKGARVHDYSKSKGPHRGFRRAEGLRMIEITKD